MEARVSVKVRVSVMVSMWMRVIVRVAVGTWETVELVEELGEELVCVWVLVIFEAE